MRKLAAIILGIGAFVSYRDYRYSRVKGDGVEIAMNAMRYIVYFQTQKIKQEAVTRFPSIPRAMLCYDLL